MEILALFFFSSSISLFVAYLFLFFKVKISLHTLALGLFTAFLGIMSYYFKIKLLFLIASLFLLSGYIAHVRLKLGAHTNLEVYLGFLLGIIIEMVCFTLLF
ncbi:MAG TPA: hypothetical protein ENK67_05115 [Flavobacteriia bacterium]|nr:hypothetical protein [Flavobacteriia bacterium]